MLCTMLQSARMSVMIGHLCTKTQLQALTFSGHVMLSSKQINGNKNAASTMNNNCGPRATAGHPKYSCILEKFYKSAFLVSICTS